MSLINLAGQYFFSYFEIERAYYRSDDYHESISLMQTGNGLILLDGSRCATTWLLFLCEKQ